jgi:hypothetical protein
MEHVKKVYTPKPANYLYSVPKPPMLIGDILPAQALVGLSGYPGSGKSWLSLEMSRALATGTPFLGQFPVKQTTVLFIGSDSSEFDYGTCWKRLTLKQYEALGGEKPTEYDDEGNGTNDLNVLSDRVRFLIQSDFSFDSDDKVDALIEGVNFEWGLPYTVEGGERVDEDGIPFHASDQIVQPRGAKIIFIDTFGSVTDADMIDNTKMIWVYRRIRRLVERARATVVLLHHNPKGSDSWLGAISQVGKLDSWMQLGRNRSMPEDQVRMTFKKFRGIKPDPIHFQLNVRDPDEASLVWCPTPGKRGETAPSEIETPADDDWALVLELVQREPRTMADLVRAKQGGFEPCPTDEAARAKFKRLLPKMVEAGKVVLLESGAGKATVWGPSPDGVDG